MKSLVFDITTGAATVLIGAGVGARFGWPEASITIGALVLVIAFTELAVFRGKRG
jgi:hypothetical protein